MEKRNEPVLVSGVTSTARRVDYYWSIYLTCTALLGDQYWLLYLVGR